MKRKILKYLIKLLHSNNNDNIEEQVYFPETLFNHEGDTIYNLHTIDNKRMDIDVIILLSAKYLNDEEKSEICKFICNSLNERYFTGN